VALIEGGFAQHRVILLEGVLIKAKTEVPSVEGTQGMVQEVVTFKAELECL
jgi:hypothetical protein